MTPYTPPKPLAVRGLGPWPDRTKKCTCEHRTNQHRGSTGKQGTKGYSTTGRCLVCDCQRYERKVGT